MGLIWEEVMDYHDNTEWEVNSCLNDEGCRFTWRVVPTLFKNCVVFHTHNSDYELIVGDWEAGNDYFDTVDEAKGFCETKENDYLCSLI